MQPELPYYGDYPTEAFTFDPIRDLKELITHYRRYVSLATYCMGNEGLLGRPLGIEIYKLVKQSTPTGSSFTRTGASTPARTPISGTAPSRFGNRAVFPAMPPLSPMNTSTSR